ncbi:hypothetical protein, partial [Lactococcus cremoris]
VNSHLLKAENKRDRKLSFLFAWGLGQTPNFGNCSCQNFPQESSDRPYLYVNGSVAKFENQTRPL